MNNLEKVEASTRLMKRLGIGIAVFAVGMFGLFLFIGAAVLYALVTNTLEGSASAAIHAGNLELHVLYACIFFIGLLGAASILVSIGFSMYKGSSPFTVGHARGIAILGCLFLCNALISLFNSGRIEFSFFGGSIFFFPHSLYFEFSSGDMAFDFGSVLAAMFLFVLALVWWYGTIIQEQTQDLV
ncbi:hypothetical protein KPC83_00505 [Collinsella sp. zg1085]|uniref:hypothetical protein n=1 Tax=Collinsella sp. zg1085 TaxID=2844380 RepID=UPI001C0C83F2|nr:hypothetical protein [Collinsella sp. zg1085]QWT17689.1 hypothetical protein KPC83_00505 [Collinsella sp. zg1085]